MVVHEIAGAPAMTDVLVWDAVEKEWRIGHLRQDHWVACNIREADELITDGEPVSIFALVTHWAPLPMPVEC